MSGKKRVPPNAGMTIVELMMAALILGVLAAVAIPQYARYRDRSRQAEAKVSLSTLYSSMQTFRPISGSYTGCLRFLGYLPPSSDYYTVGFSGDAVSALKCGPEAGGRPCNEWNWLVKAVSPSPGGVDNKAYPPTCLTDGPMMVVGTGDQWHYFRARADLCTECQKAGKPTPPEGSFLDRSYVDQNVFTAQAVGGISSLGVRYDIWSIDHNQSISNDQGTF